MNATELLALAALVPNVVGEWYSSGDDGMEDARYGPMSSAAARDIMVARCVTWLVERGSRMFTAARFGEGDYRIDIGDRNFPMPRGDTLLVALVAACRKESVMTANDGGPAFPTEPNSPGMSLRDYFAAKAMQAMLSTCYETMRGKEDAKSSAEADRTTFARDFMITEEDGPPEVASDAYTIADAMIAARQPEPLR